MATTIPGKTNALQISKTGGLEVLEFVEIDTPTPKPEEFLLKIEWGGINFIDTYHRGGLYPVPLPFTLGQEASAVVVKLPTSPELLENPAFKRRGFKVGDRVAVLADQMYRNYTTAPWQRVAKLPEDVDPRYGASFIQGLTALTAMKESYEVKKGDWILIHTVAGGLGLQFAQIGKALGANIIGTTSTPEKAELAKQHGADHVILYRNENVADAVLKLTGGVGVDAVFDGVGKDTWEANFKLIKRKGTIVTIGNASGAVPPFSVFKLMEKNVKVVRPKVMVYLVTPEEWDQYTQEYIELLRNGLKIPFYKEYPFSLEGVRQSQIDLTGGGTTGKLVVKIGGGARL